MRFNFLKKVVVGGLITSLCLCCCFLNFNNNVRASSVNDYQDENSWFQGSTEYTGINDINDLKGKTFTISTFDLYSLRSITGAYDMYINILERDYIGIEINEETHETIQCIDYLQYPYIIYEAIDDSTGNSIFSLFSFYLESDDNYSIFYISDTSLNANTKIQLQGSLVNQRINNFAYLPLNNIVERFNVPLAYCQFERFDSTNTVYLNYSNFDFLTEEDFLNNLDSYYPPTYQYANFYFVFPNTDRYSLAWSEPYALFFFDRFTYIQPYNANIEDQILSRIEGYNNGYDAGFLDGTTGGGVFSIFTGIFTSVNGILQMEIFPNVKLGYFIWLPLTLGVVGLILTFWRKD